jgi:hypothetical protein
MMNQLRERKSHSRNPEKFSASLFFFFFLLGAQQNQKKISIFVGVLFNCPFFWMKKFWGLKKKKNPSSPVLSVGCLVQSRGYTVVFFLLCVFCSGH